MSRGVIETTVYKNGELIETARCPFPPGSMEEFMMDTMIAIMNGAEVRMRLIS